MSSSHTPRRGASRAWPASLALLMTACGGGTPVASTSPQAQATGATASAAAVPAVSQVVEAHPTFHMLPAALPEPDNTDADGLGRSARLAPHRMSVPAAQAALGTSRLTPQALSSHLDRMRAQGVTSPMAAAMAATTYTPAQMRAAYGLPPLNDGVAALGAGQTIYIVDANDDPNAFAELQAFNTKFGLPACTNVAISTTQALPLATPPNTCTFSKVYATSAGTRTATAPAYDAGWASEIALDVQWAHAMAPLARIVLIEASSAANNALMGAINLAAAMGPGVVSMSFGAGEGSWVAGTDSAFTGSNMTYLASTGDSGYEVNWPAVMPRVLAVGGTTLTWSGSGSRSEAAWSGSGGGVSAYVAMPSYQSTVTIPGQKATKMRGVADVSFNADPYSGQYVAVMPKAGGAAGWYSYGGTSIACPQWAGLLAVANAVRAASAKTPLGLVHVPLYQQIAPLSGSYAAAFADVATGNDGTCSNCKAISGYDIPTGLGTPNFSSLIPLLNDVVLPPLPAATLPAGVGGKAWTASWAATDSNGGTLNYGLTGAPSGLTISGSTLSWDVPVVGTYSIGVTVSNDAGQSVATKVSLTIAKPVAAPVVTAAAAAGSVGKAFSLQVKASSPGALVLSYSLTSGAPSGMTISSTGVLNWASPVVGVYPIVVRATDTQGGYGEGRITLTVTQPNRAPTVTAASYTLTAGTAWTEKAQTADADGNTLTCTATGMPSGMTVSSACQMTWSKPVKGTYTVTVTAKDPGGLTGSGKMTLTVK